MSSSDPDPKLIITDLDPDPANNFGADRIHNTDYRYGRYPTDPRSKMLSGEVHKFTYSNIVFSHKFIVFLSFS